MTLKRAVDIVVAVVGLIVLAPTAALAMVCIRLESSGPPLVVHRGLYKFRTRTCERRADGTFSSVTYVGRFLEYSALRNLPLLANVLAGDISAVDANRKFYGELFSSTRPTELFGRFLGGEVGQEAMESLRSSYQSRLVAVKGEVLKTSLMKVEYVWQLVSTSVAILVDRVCATLFGTE